MQFLILLEYMTKTQFNSCHKGAHRHDEEASPHDQYGQANIHTDDQGAYIEGSFCPTSYIGAVRFGKVGKRIDYWIMKDNNNGDTSKSSDYYDKTWITCPSGEFTHNMGGNYYAYKCYPFYIKLTEECDGPTDVIWVDIDGTDLNTNNAISGSSGSSCNSYNDCRPFHYGKKCSGSVPEFNEGTQCSINLGKSGDGKCTSCLNVQSIQDYCKVQTNQNLIFSSQQGYPFSDSNWKQLREASAISAPTNSETETYMVYRYLGYVLIPTTTTIQFKLKSKTPASIRVGTVTSETDIPLQEADYLNCDSFLLSSPREYQISVQSNSITTYEIEIKFYSGCSLNDMEVSLQWNPGGSFTDINSIYLFHA